MNEMIINEIANDLGVSTKQVIVVLELLSEGNTIPFIARYRKEATGALDEEGGRIARCRPDRSLSRRRVWSWADIPCACAHCGPCRH